ncbi:hydroxyacylglutathione hydrolase [Legionella worsleiensis]|uniref:hydroxyacylglutathione hydrolase n=1 Tax=Legionella worsleiensis TaxID=45076 RepID=UPI0007317DAE|nr:hydroxyacylglutathione hydrolase [Legionella worsleiensis]
MQVTPIPAFTDNYIWAITEDNSHVFDCVDPGEAEPVLHFAQKNQLELRTILLTHHHNDHIGGVSDLIQAYPDCQVYGPNDSRIPHITKTVCEHQKIQIGTLSFQVLFNPGHTSTHISYFETEKKWLFCGDTLFSAGCGRVFDGTIEQLHESLNLFKTLPPNTLVFCAHEYTQQNLKFALSVEPQNKSIKDNLDQFSSNPPHCSLPSPLERELAVNPFLRTDKKEVIEYALQHGAGSADSLEVFKILRMKKNSFQ